MNFDVQLRHGFLVCVCVFSDGFCGELVQLYVKVLILGIYDGFGVVGGRNWGVFGEREDVGNNEWALGRVNFKFSLGGE